MNKLPKLYRDNLPEPFIHTAPLFRNKLIKNKEFNKYYKLLENRERLSSEHTEYQLNQLKQVLIYAYQNVPYYRELFDKATFDPYKFSDFEQIKQIPFLTREIIRNNSDKLITTGKIKNGYYIGKTGGSTGLPLNPYLDYDSVYKENAFIYYYRKKSGYKFSDKMATFRQVDFGNKLWKYNPMHNELIFSPMKLSKVTLSVYAKKINELRPDYLNGYLSAIWYFGKLLEEYSIKLTFKLKGIFLISENLDPEQRKFVEQFYNVKSITFYGHSERCVIAEEMTPNRYQFDPYYGYTEQIHIEDDKYSIVGTGFLNHIMPFIRYKTDEYVYLIINIFQSKEREAAASDCMGLTMNSFEVLFLCLEIPYLRILLYISLFRRKKGKLLC